MAAASLNRRTSLATLEKNVQELFEEPVKQINVLIWQPDSSVSILGKPV